MTSSLLTSVLQSLSTLASIVLPTSPLYTTSTLATSSATSTPSLLETYINHHPRPPLFELEPLLAACAISFCRFVIVTGSLSASPEGHSSVFFGTSSYQRWEFGMRLLMAILLGGMTYLRMSYDLICAVHLWSHLLPWMLKRVLEVRKRDNNRVKKNDAGGTPKKKKTERSNNLDNNPPSIAFSMAIASITLFSFPFSLILCRLISTPSILLSLVKLLPQPIKDMLMYMFPIVEMMASYDIITAFVSDHELLHLMLKHLLFVTFHIQVGMGHIGISFLTSEQRRKNMLIRMDVDNPEPKEENEGVSGGKESNTTTTKTTTTTRNKKFDPSRAFRRSAPSFILFCVLPYMFQIILFGNLNNFSFMYVRNEIHRSVRIEELFNHVSQLCIV